MALKELQFTFTLQTDADAVVYNNTIETHVKNAINEVLAKRRTAMASSEITCTDVSYETSYNI